MLGICFEHQRVRFSGIRHNLSLEGGSALTGRGTETFSERYSSLYTLIVLRGVCGAGKICLYLRLRCDWQLQTKGFGRGYWGYRTKTDCSYSSEHGEEARSAGVLQLPQWKPQGSDFTQWGRIKP
jgi:hypothetical protein